jgi:lysophospholipase L1-like esterase
MSVPRSRAKTLVFVCALSILGTVALLLAAETTVRIKYALFHKDPAYLVMGILPAKTRGTPRPAADAPGPAGPIKIAIGRGTTQWNDCAQRDIYYRVNRAGGRGPEWVAEKPAGSIRILAIGESSTFGSANAEDHTWPALLGNALRSEGLTVDMLNFGIPGQRIKGMIKLLPAVLDKYRPDVVAHYAGFNETWVDAEAPAFLRFLNYRSMLYTYIYEKMYFRAEASPQRLVPDTRTYERDFTTLVQIARDRGARVVVIQQAVAGGATAREGAACAANWQDQDALRTCLNDLMTQPDPRFSRLLRTRMFKTVVLQRVLADVAAREQVSVFDPRDVLVEGHNGRHLFCDEIHPTDQGNEVLVGAIAAPFAAYLKSQALAPSGS